MGVDRVREAQVLCRWWWWGENSNSGGIAPKILEMGASAVVETAARWIKDELSV